MVPILRNFVLIRQHILEHLPCRVARLGKGCPQGKHNRLWHVCGFADGRDGTQGAQGEAGIELLDGLLEQVKVVDDDWRLLGVCCRVSG